MKENVYIFKIKYPISYNLIMLIYEYNNQDMLTNKMSETFVLNFKHIIYT